jgi:hypothetical protein
MRRRIDDRAILVREVASRVTPRHRSAQAISGSERLSPTPRRESCADSAPGGDEASCGVGAVLEYLRRFLFQRSVGC